MKYWAPRPFRAPGHWLAFECLVWFELTCTYPGMHRTAREVVHGERSYSNARLRIVGLQTTGAAMRYRARAGALVVTEECRARILGRVLIEAR